MAIVSDVPAPETLSTYREMSFRYRVLRNSASKVSDITRLGNLSEVAVFCPEEAFNTSSIVDISSPWVRPKEIASDVAVNAKPDS